MKSRYILIIIIILVCLVPAFLISHISLNTAEIIASKFHQQTDTKESVNGLPPSGERTNYEYKKRRDEGIPVPDDQEEVIDVNLLNTDNDTSNLIVIFLSTAVIALLIAFWWIRSIKRKRLKSIYDIPTESNLSHEKMVKNSPEFIGIKETHTLSKKSSNKLIQLLHEWHSKLNKHNQKRSSETIREWIERIDGPNELIEIFEDNRYGNFSLTAEEIKRFSLVLSSNSKLKD